MRPPKRWSNLLSEDMMLWQVRTPTMRLTSVQIILAFSLCCLGCPVKGQEESVVAETLKPISSNLPDIERRQSSEDAQNSGSAYPSHLDMSSIQNMPLVILHPRRPVQLELLSGQHITNLQKALNMANINKLIQSNYETHSETNNKFTYRPKDGEEEGHESSSNNKNRQYENSQFGNQPDFMEGGVDQLKTSKYGMLTPPQFMQHGQVPSRGWMDKLRVSFSHLWPRRRPAHPPSVFYPSPSSHRPSFIPSFGGFNPYVNPFTASASSFALPSFSPWSQRFHQGNPLMDYSELSPIASDRLPVTAAHPDIGYSPFSRPYPGMFPHAGGHGFHGSDLYTSSSQPIPAKLPPPKGFRLTRKLFARPSRFSQKYVLPPTSPGFTEYATKFPKHRPLFNNVEGLGATSLEISNAFADFADSHEQGADVTQRFGSVGDSVNKFLHMMGLGVAGFSSPEIGAFGGGGEYASMDSTPIARSMDFYPGYGNQAHLDQYEDMDIFEHDITDLFAHKFQNLIPEKEMKPMAMPMKKAEATSTSKMPTTTTKSTIPTTAVPKYTEMVKPSMPVKEMNMMEQANKSMMQAQGMNMTEPGKGLAMQIQGMKMMDQEKKMGADKMEKMIGQKMKPGEGETTSSGMKGQAQESGKAKQTDNRPNMQAAGENNSNMPHTQSQEMKGPRDKHSLPYMSADNMSENKNEKKETQMSHHSDVKAPEKFDYGSMHPVLPAVSYRIPPTYPTAAPQDHRQPILIYQNIPAPIRVYHKTTTSTESPQKKTTYAPAHSLPENHRLMDSIIRENSSRRWIPVTTNNGPSNKQVDEWK